MQSFFVTLSQVFTAVALVMSFAKPAFGNASCLELFRSSQNTGLFRPIPSDYIGLIFSLKDMFAFDKSGLLNKSLSATKLKRDVLSLPNGLRLLRAQEVEVAVKIAPRIEYLSVEITYRLWMIFFAVDPQSAIREFKSQILKEDSRPEMLQFIGEYFNS